MITAPVSTPRQDHNPASPFQPIGLLMEESKANLITYSVLDGGTNWTYAADNTVGTPYAATAPDGTTLAASLADNSTSGQHYTTPAATIAVTSGTTYAFSVFVKPGTATDVQLALPSPPFPAITGSYEYTNFNITSGTVVNGCTSCGAIQALSNGWYRLSMTATASSSASMAPVIAFTNNSTSATGGVPSYVGSGEYLYLWGAQFEQTALTSYIPTAGASVTRGEDTFYVLATANGGWLTNNVGTMGSTYFTNALTSNAQGVASLTNGTGAQSLSLMINSSGHVDFQNYNSGVSYNGVTAANPTYTVGTVVHEAGAFATTPSPGFEGCAILGVVCSPDGNSALPATQSRLSIGHVRGNDGGSTIGPLDGYIQRFWYMPTTQPDSGLVALTE